MSLLFGDLWHLNSMFELVSNLLRDKKLVSLVLSLLVSRFSVCDCTVKGSCTQVVNHGISSSNIMFIIEHHVEACHVLV
jgi:hypothetical protein